jgi:hypothetical protein
MNKLKADARRYYLEYHSILDEFSCGANLAEHVSSRLAEAKSKFNKVMDRLAVLDQNCPKVRL